jgi:hypothetical protein
LGELFPQEREPGVADAQEFDAAHWKHGLTTVATPTVAALDQPPQKADAAAAGLIRGVHDPDALIGLAHSLPPFPARHAEQDPSAQIWGVLSGGKPCER